MSQMGQSRHSDCVPITSGLPREAELARQTSRAVLANAPAPPQAQRTKNRRPKIRRCTLQPARDIRGRFRISMLHVRHVMLYTCSDQAKSHEKNRKKPASFSAKMHFATETSLVSVAKHLHLF